MRACRCLHRQVFALYGNRVGSSCIAIGLQWLLTSDLGCPNGAAPFAPIQLARQHFYTDQEEDRRERWAQQAIRGMGCQKAADHYTRD